MWWTQTGWRLEISIGCCRAGGVSLVAAASEYVLMAYFQAWINRVVLLEA